MALFRRRMDAFSGARGSPRRFAHLFTLLLVWFSPLAAGSSTERDEASEAAIHEAANTRAVLLESAGDVRIQRPGSPDVVELRVGESLTERDRLLIGARARAVLYIYGGTIAEVGADKDLSITPDQTLNRQATTFRLALPAPAIKTVEAGLAAISAHLSPATTSDEPIFDALPPGSDPESSTLLSPRNEVVLTSTPLFFWHGRFSRVRIVVAQGETLLWRSSPTTGSWLSYNPVAASLLPGERYEWWIESGRGGARLSQGQILRVATPAESAAAADVESALERLEPGRSSSAGLLRSAHWVGLGAWSRVIQEAAELSWKGSHPATVEALQTLARRGLGLPGSRMDALLALVAQHHTGNHLTPSFLVPGQAAREWLWLSTLHCASRDDCNHALEEIRAGKRFEDVARGHPQERNPYGEGDAEILKYADLPAGIAQAAAELTPGQTAGPIAVSGGYFLLHLPVVGMDQPTRRRDRQARDLEQMVALAEKRAQEAFDDCAADHGGPGAPCAERVTDAVGQRYGSASLEAAQISHRTAELRAARGDFVGAVTALEESLRVRERVLGLGHRQSLLTLGDLGFTLAAAGDYVRARALLERAAEASARRLGREDSVAIANALLLAEVLYQAGDYAEAKTVLEKCRATALGLYGLGHQTTTLAHYFLARMAQDAGDISRAIYLLEEAARSAEMESQKPARGTIIRSVTVALMGWSSVPAPASSNPFEPAYPTLAGILGTLTEAYEGLDNYGKAEPPLRKALALVEGGGRVEQIDSAPLLIRLARLTERRGDADEARELLERALGIREELLGADHPLVGDSLVAYGSFRLRRGEYDAARQQFERAVALREVTLGPAHPSVGVALSKLAWTRLLGAPAESERSRAEFLRAVSVFEASGVRRNMWEPLAGLGRVAEIQEDWAKAGSDYRSAIRALESTRWLPPAEDGESPVRDRLWIFESLERVLYRLHEGAPGAGHDMEMFEVAERGRARALLELLATPRTGLHRGAGKEWQRQEAEALRELNQAQRALARSRVSSEGLSIEGARLRAAEEVLVQLDEELLEGDPRLAALDRFQPVNRSTLQGEVLRPGETVLAYALGDEESFLFVISDGEFTVVPLPPRAAVDELVSKARVALGTPSGRSSSTGFGEAERVLLPLAESTLARSRSLLVIPDGSLFFLPFEVLGKAVDKLPMTYFPSVSVLALERKSAARPRRAERILALAPFASVDVDVADGGVGARALARDTWKWTALWFSRDEVDGIARLYGGGRVVTRTNSEARETTLREAAALESGILHLATHAFVDSEAPRRSVVVLSQEKKVSKAEDGLLTLSEIFALQLNAEMVVLSACETGLGTLERGEGMAGLARGFLHAGARSVVVSLWKVSNRSTSMLMERFYAYLKEGRSQAEALHLAKQALRGDPEHPERSHPFYWAPFILVGDGE